MGLEGINWSLVDSEEEYRMWVESLHAKPSAEELARKETQTRVDKFFNAISKSIYMSETEADEFASLLARSTVFSGQYCTRLEIDGYSVIIHTPGLLVYFASRFPKHRKLLSEKFPSLISAPRVKEEP